jgi:hypothetical protein
MRMHLIPAALSLTLVVSAAGGCAGLSTASSGHAPRDATQVAALLTGAWNVHEATGEVSGLITFVPAQVELIVGDAFWSGTWTVEEDRSVSWWQLTLTLHPVDDPGRIEAFTLQLIVSDRMDLIVLESQGRWTRWARLEG